MPWSWCACVALLHFKRVGARANQQATAVAAKEKNSPGKLAKSIKASKVPNNRTQTDMTTDLDSDDDLDLDLDSTYRVEKPRSPKHKLTKVAASATNRSASHASSLKATQQTGTQSRTSSDSGADKTAARKSSGKAKPGPAQRKSSLPLVLLV